MRIKNMTGDLYSRCWISISLRDLVVLGCCLVYEHYSLKAFLGGRPRLEPRLVQTPLDHGTQAGE